MSYRYKDWHSQPSSLPRRYYSLPRDYNSQDSNSRVKDTTYSSKHRTSSASAATPSTHSWRHGGSRTYGAPSDVLSTSDVKTSASHRSGTSAASSLGTSSFSRKSSLGRDKGSSLPSSPTKMREPSHIYSVRHVATFPHRESTGHKSSWDPGTTPVRQHSSSSLKESFSTWGPDTAPVRQNSSSSLRDSPFGLTSSRRKYSSSRDSTSDGANSASIQRTPSPTETLPKRSTSPSNVFYEGSRLKSEPSTSPVSPTALHYHGSLSRQGSSSSKSDVSTAAHSWRGSGKSTCNATQDVGIGIRSDNGTDASTAKDISLLSREITSAYEGSLSRTDSRKGKNPLLSSEGKTDQSAKVDICTKVEKSSRDLSRKGKDVSKASLLGRGHKLSREKSHGTDSNIGSHNRSSSVGSSSSKDEGKSKGEKYFGRKTGFFSNKKSRDSTDSEGEEERRQQKGSGFFQRRRSSGSEKGSPTRQGVESSLPSFSPAVVPPKRKISGPSSLFFNSGESKTTPDLLKKKFSVPGKYFPSKESKSGGESSDNMDLESGRLSRPPIKRRVSLPGILGLQRSSSAERAQVNLVQSVDPDGLSRRTNFKKTRSFDSSKNTVLNKLKFWDHTKKDKSPDSRKSTSSDDGRSRSLSPASSSIADQNLVDEVFATDGNERKSSQLRKSRERTVKAKSFEERPTPGGKKRITTEKIKPDQGLPLLDKGRLTLQVESVPSSDGPSQRDKESKVQYVGRTDSPLLAELRAKRRAQYKVNSNEKGSGSSMDTAEQKTDDEVKKEQSKPFNLTDSSTRDTVSKLRERRRRRKEERERFFAGLVPNLAKESNQEEGCKDEGGKELVTETQQTPVIARQDAVDGKLHFGENGFIQKNGLIHSQNSSIVRQTPQLSEVGKKYTIDDMSNTEKVKSGKPRYQTIASSVHADIIADLIREKGLKTTDAEVKIPSVAELRAKFLMSKDDNKVIPPRPVIKLEDRPHSICGDTLSPTEMRKFDEINFSLAKKVSSSKINEQKFPDSSSEMLSPEDVSAELEIIDEKASLQNSLSSQGGQKAPRGESTHNETSSKDLEKDPRDLSPEGEVRKKRGSKKKRKKSLFGGDKEAKGIEEESEMPQSGAVSAAIKAMFTRRGSVDKSKISRKQRSKTIGSEGRTEILKGVADQRERKKSSPEYLPPNLTVGEMQTKGVGKKEVKNEKVEVVKDNVKAKELESKFHVKGKDIEQNALGKDKDMERNVPVKVKEVERKALAKDKEVEKKIPAKDKEMERKVLEKDKELERKVSGRDVDSERKLSEKDTDILLQPIEDIELKSTKERKSLKKPSKNKKRKSLKPFSMMKTKSESNLLQRFDFVAVEIPLENEEEEKQDWNEKEPVEKQVDDKPSVQEGLSSPIITGRRPSVFEEGLREFYDMKSAKQDADLKKPEPSKMTITLEDLDAVSNQTAGKLTSSLAEDRMKIRPKRHHRTKSNPIKNLQNREDVRTDTEVEKPRIEKKPVTSEHPVIKRKKKKYKDPDNLYRRHTLDLAASALAGLASTEDFTKVLLRKTAGPNEKDEYRGTKPTMLIHIKGRRHLQVRLTEPCQKSLNSGDCFALVTEKDLFAWIGKDCNPYEKAKVTEIVSKIKTKSELDCKAREIVTIEEGDEDNIAALDKFWKILSGDPNAKIKDGETLPKDEEYEKGVVKGNMVYKIHWTDPPTLMPVETMCGHLPQVSILDTKEVFVFDFGSELYVWNGHQSLSGQRKSAFALARQLYEQPFKPYSIYDPIYPYGKSDQCIIEVDNKHPSKRPQWTLFARLHEKAETILFREKFLDWPDPTKIIRMKGHPSCLELAPQPSPPVELRPCDVKKMLQDPGPLRCPTFEGVNVGRGNGVPTVWVGDVYKEGNLVTTVGLTVWHINEYRHFELPSSHHGHFHSGEGYVIRWAYFVLADRVVKDRKSRCRSTVAGRVRCAYFFWQGNDCSVNEKGAAAIMAVELDEEKGPQVRVIQGKENPVFLNLFKGGMVIHQGSAAKSWYEPETKKVDESAVSFTDTSTVRMYVIRNEEPGEACLHQVKASSSSLRSRTSFVLLLCRKAHIFLWHGSKSSEDSRSTAKTAAKKIQERKSVECNVAEVSAITLTEVEEGNETDDFWKELGGKKYYCSLANDPAKHRYQPRLFELSSATGNFASSEVLCPSRSEPKVCPFPFLQDDLYAANQPGLFIVDGYYEVYVWEGWMLENDDDVRTGSGRQRWDRDRRLAMQTALNYAKEVGKRVSHRVYVVYAGMEPQSFKVLFPYWNDSHDVTRIQKQDGKQANAKHLASDLLESFTKEFYTLEELRRVPPPQGVDPSKLEEYLNDNDFKDIFKMDKEAFNKLPLWKRQDLKKPVGLF